MLHQAGAAIRFPRNISRHSINSGVGIGSFTLHNFIKLALAFSDCNVSDIRSVKDMSANSDSLFEHLAAEPDGVVI
jgi:hypothetical protein